MLTAIAILKWKSILILRWNLTETRIQNPRANLKLTKTGIQTRRPIPTRKDFPIPRLTRILTPKWRPRPIPSCLRRKILKSNWIGTETQKSRRTLRAIRTPTPIGKPKLNLKRTRTSFETPKRTLSWNPKPTAIGWTTRMRTLTGNPMPTRRWNRRQIR